MSLCPWDRDRFRDVIGEFLVGQLPFNATISLLEPGELCIYLCSPREEAYSVNLQVYFAHEHTLRVSMTQEDHSKDSFRSPESEKEGRQLDKHRLRSCR